MIFGRWQQSLVVDGTPVPVPPNEEGLGREARPRRSLHRAGKAHPPPCSRIESRAVMTFRAFKDREATHSHGKVESPLNFFDLAVYSALAQMRPGIRLPADSPVDEVELIVRVYYNENAWLPAGRNPARMR